ncbi:hypothetical protein KHQ81_15900 (plasmid) [Mycoplasmatota bacterium]|nr:hypothetical protein KHQ81_15900 [Mycoplasmatota bacterium]
MNNVLLDMTGCKVEKDDKGLYTVVRNGEDIAVIRNDEIPGKWTLEWFQMGVSQNYQKEHRTKREALNYLLNEILTRRV